MTESEPKLEFPDRRRHGYVELEHRIDQHYGHLEGRLGRFIERSLMAFAVLGLTSAFSLLGFGLVLQNETENSGRIQQERYSTLLQNCIQQNTRHDRALIKAREALPAQSQRAVILLVNELQPYVVDCDEYAANRVRGRP